MAAVRGLGGFSADMVVSDYQIGNNCVKNCRSTGQKQVIMKRSKVHYAANMVLLPMIDRKSIKFEQPMISIINNNLESFDCPAAVY